MLPRLLALLLLLATATALPPSIRAQSDQSLSIRGSIADPTGAIVPNVTIRLESATCTTLVQAQADSHGDFALLNLAPGDVTLVIPPATAPRPS